MRKLRIGLIFTLAALSMAWAQCPSFILANTISDGVSSSSSLPVSSTINHTVRFGDDVTFQVAGIPEEDITWRVGLTPIPGGSIFELPAFPNTNDGPFTYILDINGCAPVTVNIYVTERKHTVSFHDGAALISTETVGYHDKVSKPTPDPSRLGYEFKGWDFDFDTPITRDTTIDAKWEIITYSITYHANGGTGASNRTYTVEDQAITLPTPSRTGYAFGGWYEDAGFAIPATTIPAGSTGNKNFYAKWDIITYSITYHPDGGTGATDGTYTVETPTITLPIPSKAGHAFEGWHENSSLTGTPVLTIPAGSTGNKNFYAKWKINTYTVQFQTGSGGSPVANQTIEHNGAVAAPAPPTRTGYDFDYWELNGFPYDFSSPVTTNITLTAVWEPKILKVNFIADDPIPTQEIPYNSMATAPPNPVREFHDFDYWALNGARYNFNTPVTSDITLSAVWKPKQYTISFDAQGGNVSPASKAVTYGEAIGALPTPTRYAYEFKGWFTGAEGTGTKYEASTIYSNTSVLTLYAHWEFIKGTRPTAAMLNAALPSGLTYNGLPINPIDITQKATVERQLGTITALYNGSEAPPKDAGIYTLTAFIAKSEDYDSATVSLGNFIIAQAKATLNVVSAIAESREYNAERTAKITEIYFDESSLFESDKVSPSDYAINANFATPNVGENIEVNLVVSWLSNGPLSKNYILESTPFVTSANITRATGFLTIKAPEVYELSNPIKPSILHANSFIKDGDIIWEYKREEDSDDAYSTNLPNRVGNWVVKATLEETDNYTGAMDYAIFLVTRGSATTVIHNVAFEEPGFARDGALSGNLLHYFVAGAELCNIDNAIIKITVVEPDIVLSLGNIPQKGEFDSDGFAQYEIPINFGKPGVDTLIYALLSRDGIYVEYDTILIETPVPFNSVSGQKWNNVLFINNNPKTNGGYKFSEYKWFKNGVAVGEMQFYSAGPSSSDTLNPSDVYTVTMHTTDGMRISTCKGSPKSETEQKASSAYAKQVLGINGKTASQNAKIYNSKGERSEGRKPGVYIVEE